MQSVNSSYNELEREVFDAARLTSHDFRYENGKYIYHNTYAGGEEFVGEEVGWREGQAVYAMNYMGRVLADGFSGNFLKEALRAADVKRYIRVVE